jgi:hypothetical protein
VTHQNFGGDDVVQMGADVAPTEVTLARDAREGKEVPKSLDGRLAVRLALPLDALLRLQQQLQQVLTGLRGGKGGTNVGRREG